MINLCSDKMFWLGLILFIFLAILGLVLSRESYQERKWSCTENGCEMIIGGDYKTKEECQTNGCKLSDKPDIINKIDDQKKKVKFSNSINKYFYDY